MLRKITIALAGVSLISLLIATIHGRFGSATAWATSWLDDSDNGNEIEPDKKAPPPNIAGAWSGSIDDNDAGTGSLSLDVTQKNSKINGEFDCYFGSGSFSGSINSAGVIKFTAKLEGSCKGTCHLQVNASLPHPTEMSGTYKVQGCKHAKGDSGTFLVTD
jgi:hypothetical protein